MYPLSFYAAAPVWPFRLEAARHQLVAALLHASALLLHAAVRLQHRPRPAAAPRPESLEYHAEACAPEGALYADGRFLGWLDGVQRL
jgi:hypothetical protein